jgi:putative RecB family exonuclease
MERTMAELKVPEDSSASQLVCWVMCPRKYFFRYVLKLDPEFRSVALVLGSALHSAIGWFFQERLDGGSPQAAEAEDVFDADLHAEVSVGSVRWKIKTADEVMEEGRGLVRAYLDRFNDLPVAFVEQPFRVSIEDPETGLSLPRAFKGYFDLVLEDGTVVEMKSAARKWNPFDLVRHLQIGAYVAAKCELDGGPVTVDVHVVTKTRTPQVDVHQVTRGEPDNRWWFQAAMDIERAILAGHFPPSPGPTCYECEYQRHCETWVGVARENVRHLPIAAHAA